MNLKKHLLIGTILGSVAGMGLTAPASSAGEIASATTSPVELKRLADLGYNGDPTEPAKVEQLARAINRFINSGDKRTETLVRAPRMPYVTVIPNPVLTQSINYVSNLRMDGKDKVTVQLFGEELASDVLPTSHPTYQTAKKANELYNAAHPNATAKMPHHVLVTDGFKGMLTYATQDGFMLIDRSVLSLPEDKQIGLFAHEYRHEAQMQAGMLSEFVYSAKETARVLNLDMASLCTGINDSDRALMLPSNAGYFQLGRGTNYQEEIIRNEMIGGLALLTDRERFKAVREAVRTMPECDNAIRSIHDHAAAAITITGKERLAHLRAIEHDSDMAAVDTLRYAIKTGQLSPAIMKLAPATVMANALTAMDNGVEAKAGIFHTHPSLKNRLKVMGCELNKQGKTFVARCEETVANSARGM